MKNAKKIVALLLSAVLLVGASVAGTLAYLTFTTNEVKNTFTVGKVNLGVNGEGGLDEADVNEYGELLYVSSVEGAAPVVKDDANATGNLAARVKENTYKLIPGHSYVKDPKIHILQNSESCYLFVKVENGIAAIEDGTTIAAQMTANGWVPLDGFDGYFYLNITTEKTGENKTKDYPVFESFKLKTDANVANYENAEITVVAYAVQADGFNSAAEAWAATFGATQNP